MSREVKTHTNLKHTDKVREEQEIETEREGKGEVENGGT